MARDFDGSADYIEKSSFPVSGYPYAISAWVNPDNVASDMIHFSINDISDDSHYDSGYGPYNTDGDTMLGVHTDGTNAAYPVTSNAMSASTWQHVLWTFDTSDGPDETQTVIVSATDSDSNTAPPIALALNVVNTR